MKTSFLVVWRTFFNVVSDMLARRDAISFIMTSKGFGVLTEDFWGLSLQSGDSVLFNFCGLIAECDQVSDDAYYSG